MKERVKPQKLEWLILILAFTSLSANAETYLCVADKATGFVKEGNEWNTAHFREDRKFSLKKETWGHWTWTQIGDQFGLSCPVQKDNKGKERKIFSCDLVWDFLVFNKDSLRFMYFKAGGYLLPGLGDDTPVTAIGKCSPL